MKKSVLLTGLILLLITGCSSSVLDTITLKTDTETVMPEQKVKIQALGNVDTFRLDENDVKSDGGKLKVNEGDIEFSAAIPGSYQIFAQKGDVVSNTLIIQVQDPDHSQAEQPAAEEQPQQQPVTDETTEQSAEAIMADPQSFADQSSIIVSGYVPSNPTADAAGSQILLLSSQADLAAGVIGEGLPLQGLSAEYAGKHVCLEGNLIHTDNEQTPWIFVVRQAQEI